MLAAAHALVGGDYGPAVGVQDAILESLRGKPAEHHRMDGPYAGTGQHGVGGLGNHGHVDAHPVTLPDAALTQAAGQPAHGRMNLAVGDLRIVSRVIALPDQRDLVAPAFKVAVDAVDADIELPAGEPARLALVEVVAGDLLPALVPVQEFLGHFRPERIGFLYRAPVHVPVARGVDVRAGFQFFGYGVDGKFGHRAAPGLLCAAM